MWFDFDDVIIIDIEQRAVGRSRVNWLISIHLEWCRSPPRSNRCRRGVYASLLNCIHTWCAHTCLSEAIWPEHSSHAFLSLDLCTAVTIRRHTHSSSTPPPPPPAYQSSSRRCVCFLLLFDIDSAASSSACIYLSSFSSLIPSRPRLVRSSIHCSLFAQRGEKRERFIVALSAAECWPNTSSRRRRWSIALFYLCPGVASNIIVYKYKFAYDDDDDDHHHNIQLNYKHNLTSTPTFYRITPRVDDIEVKCATFDRHVRANYQFMAIERDDIKVFW